MTRHNLLALFINGSVAVFNDPDSGSERHIPVVSCGEKSERAATRFWRCCGPPTCGTSMIRPIAEGWIGLLMGASLSSKK